MALGASNVHADHFPHMTRGYLYCSIYIASGYLLRSSRVCPHSTTDAKHTIDVAFRLISTPEFRTMSRGYPKLTNQWWSEGARAVSDQSVSYPQALK